MEDVMKRYQVTAIAGCLLIFSAVCVFGSAAEQPTTTGDEAAQIVALQKERVEALQKLVDICVAQCEAGTLPLESVAAAQNELIDAQLDSTDKTEERVTLLTEQLQVAENVLKYIEAKRQSGFKVAETDRLRAMSHCLNVKIKLLRERNKLNPSTK
jgi:hypothetical protein